MAKLASIMHRILCKGRYKVYDLLADLTRGHPYFATRKIQTGSILIASTLAMCTQHHEDKPNLTVNSSPKFPTSKKIAISKLADTIKRQVSDKKESGNGPFFTCYLTDVDIQTFSFTEPLDTISQVESPNYDPIYYIVENPASFPGGTDSLDSFIKKNLQYPKNAKEAGIEGYVIVSFVINKMGEVTNVEVIRGLNDELNTEAVRVVKLLPRWTPGRDKEELVQVYQTIPIHFNPEN